MTAGSVQALPLFDFDKATAATQSPDPRRDTYGYSFIVRAPTTVDGLGFFDFDSDGISTGGAHRVTLWDSTMAILDTAIVNNGTSTTGADASASGLGRYIYAGIAERILAPGHYTLGASFNGGSTDPLIDDTFPLLAGLVVNGAAVFNQGAFGLSAGNNAVFPNIPTGDRFFFGPTLRVKTAAIPEPLTPALLLAGILGIGLRRRFHGQATRIPSPA
jgi:hypothetical protein